MPSATAAGLILDHHGQPMGPGRGALYRPTREDEKKRERPPNLFNDYLALLDPRRYIELVSRCRSLASRGLVEALNESKADYVSASGYLPTFTGQDDVYGAELIEALLPALNTGNLRGARFDWRSTWRLGTIRRGTDGSYFVLLTEREDTGWPAYQVFEGHRIWQRDPGQTKVDAKDAFTILTDETGATKRVRGAYRGLNISKGIITTPVGTEVAYRVLGANPDGSDDQDISARDLIHVARPKRDSEDRPPPQMAGAGEDLIALMMANTAQLDQQIMDARRTVIESNASGKAPYNAGEGYGQPGAAPIESDEYERGSTLFIKSGMEAKPWQTTRPSDQWMNYDHRVSSRAAAVCRWRLEMIDPSFIGSGAANQAFMDQINTLAQDEFTIDESAVIRVIQYFSSKLAKLGVIANHTETRALAVAKPPYYEVNRAAAKYDLDDVAAGRTSMSTLHARDSKTSRQVYVERARAWKEAKKVSDETGVELSIVLGDLGATVQRTGAQPPPDGGGQTADQQKAA